MPRPERRRCGGLNPVGKSLCFSPAVGVPASFAGGEGPRHAVGAEEKRTDAGMQKRCLLDPKPVKAKVGPFGVNCRQNFYDALGRGVALAYRADPNPHAGLQTVAIGADMCYIFAWRIALQNRHDRERQVVRRKRIVALNREALVVRYGQPGFGEHERLAHEILRDSCADLHNAGGVEAKQLDGVIRDAGPILTIKGQFSERAGVDQHVWTGDWLLPTPKPANADTSEIEALGVVRAMEPDIEFDGRAHIAPTITAAA